MEELQALKKRPSLLPFSEELRHLKRLFFLFGIRFLDDDDSKKRVALSRFFTISYLCFWSAFFIHLGIVVQNSGSKCEVALVVLFFLFCSLTCFIYLHRYIKKIETTLLSLHFFFTSKGLRRLERYDKLMLVSLAVLFFCTQICCMCYVKYNMKFFRSTMVKTGITEEFATDTTMISKGFLFVMAYGITINGIMACSNTMYTLIMVAFRIYCDVLKRAIERVRYHMTAESVCLIRKRLRFYWDAKSQMDRLINIFPFIWMSYSFVSTTVLFTLIVVESRNNIEQHPFVLLSAYLTLTAIFFFTLRFFIMETADNAFQKCYDAAFSLSHPRFKTTVTDEQLRDQIYLLHHELTNCPKTNNTILGMARFSRKTIITFIAALVNFAVMMINIRMALKNNHNYLIDQPIICPSCVSQNQTDE